MKYQTGPLKLKLRAHALKERVQQGTKEQNKNKNLVIIVQRIDFDFVFSFGGKHWAYYQINTQNVLFSDHKNFMKHKHEE